MSDGLHEDIGYLTFPTWVKCQDAIARSAQICTELRAIGGAKIQQEGRSKATEPALPLYPGWVLADDIDRMNRQLRDRWPDDESAANSEEGAALLLRLMNAVQNAYHRFPIGQEHEHTVPTITCQQDGCRGQVRYKPPTQFAGEVQYTCARCGKIQDAAQVVAEVTTRSAAIEAEQIRAERRRAKQKRDREEAKRWE